jgi:predicted ester cyclase
LSLEENKAIVRRLYEALNKHNPALLDEFYESDYINHTLQIRGLKSLKQLETMLWKGFSDWHETIEDIIAEGDKVCIRYKVTGTHTGEFRGLAPTGKSTKFTAVSIYRIFDGKIVESWALYDFLDFYKQLGVIEYREVPEE